MAEVGICPEALPHAGWPQREGHQGAAADYYANKNKYPYQVYINWSYMDSGNILYNDKKFVSLLMKPMRIISQT